MNQGGSSRNRKAATSQSSVMDEAWLIGVAEGASKDSGGVSTEFLAGYLPMLADAATIGRAPKRAEIDAVRLQGRHAAESGVPVGRGVDLYLSAARRVWAELPAVVRQRNNNGRAGSSRGGAAGRGRGGGLLRGRPCRGGPRTRSAGKRPFDEISSMTCFAATPT